MAKKAKLAVAAPAVTTDLTFNMTTEVGAVESIEVDESAVLAGLLDELGDIDDDLIAAPEADDAGVVELIAESVGPAVGEFAGDAAFDDDAIAAAIADAERNAAMKAAYAEQKPTGLVDAKEPGTATDVVADPAPAKKEKKAKAPKAAKPPKEPKVAKAPTATSVTHKPGDLLRAKLGEK